MVGAVVALKQGDVYGFVQPQQFGRWHRGDFSFRVDHIHPRGE